MRNPLLLAKQLSSMDQLSQGRLLLGLASGWYKREFDSVGVPFEKRGKIMDQSLTIMKRLWAEDLVVGDYPPYQMKAAVMAIGSRPCRSAEPRTRFNLDA